MKWKWKRATRGPGECAAAKAEQECLVRRHWSPPLCQTQLRCLVKSVLGLQVCTVGSGLQNQQAKTNNPVKVNEAQE